MTYQDFKKIYFAAGDFNEKDLFIADNGSVWLSEYPDDRIIIILSSVWDIVNGGFCALRSITKLSQQSFAEKYFISRRTIENWDEGFRSSPPYVMLMLTYAVLSDEGII